MRRGVKEINKLYCQFREETNPNVQLELWERIDKLATAPGVVKESDFGTRLKVPAKYQLKRGGEAEPFITVGPEGMSVTRLKHAKSISNPQKWGFREEFLRALKDSPFVPKLYKAGEHNKQIFHRMEYIPGKQCKDKKEAGTILPRLMNDLRKNFHLRVTLTDLGIKNSINDLRRKHPVYVDFLLRPGTKKVTPPRKSPAAPLHAPVRRHPSLRARVATRKKEPVARHLEIPHPKKR